MPTLAELSERSLEGGATPAQVQGALGSGFAGYGYTLPTEDDKLEINIGGGSKVSVGSDSMSMEEGRRIDQERMAAAQMAAAEKEPIPVWGDTEKDSPKWVDAAKSNGYRDLSPKDKKEFQTLFFERFLAPKFQELGEDVESWHLNFLQRAQELDSDLGYNKRKSSNWDELTYGFKSMPSDVQDWSLWLESRWPLGELSIEDGYKGPEELYGAEFMAAAPEERREMLLQRREAALQEDFADVEIDEDSGWLLTGSLGGLMATPTTLAPVGTGYKAASAIGGALGFQHAAAKNLAQEGEINPAETALATTAGAVMAPAVLKAGRIVKTGLNKRAFKKQSKEVMGQFQHIVDSQVASGRTQREAYNHAKQITGLSDEGLVEASKATGIKLQLHSQKASKQIIDLERASEKGPGAITRAVRKSDNYIRPISSEINEINENLGWKLREHDYGVHTQVHQLNQRTLPFLKTMGKFKGAEVERLHKALLDGDLELLKDVLSTKYQGDDLRVILKQYKEVRGTLDDLFEQLNQKGVPIEGYIQNYWPRVIADKPGFRAAMKPGDVSKADDAIAQFFKVHKREPDVIEETEIYNKILRGFNLKDDPGSASFSWSKPRKIMEIPEELLPFYANPQYTLPAYIRRAVGNMQKKQFFGEVPDHIDESVGALVRKLRNDGDISTQQMDRLEDLLKVRFGPGELAPSKFNQDLKNVMYGTTLANPISALTQLGDIGYAAYKSGVFRTIRSLAPFSHKYVTAEEYGLVEHMVEELSSTAGSARILNKLFKVSGFSRVDRLGKEAVLNSAARKLFKQVKHKKGLDKLRDEYANVLGDEFEQAMQDLANRKMSENVKLMLWNKLADVQPISLSEMPRNYLSTPNGRIWYMMKSFTLKQIDIIRRDIAKNLKTPGKRAEGIQNLVRYSLMMSAANMTADQAKAFALDAFGAAGQRTGDIEKMIDDPSWDTFALSVLKNFGGSEYIANQLRTGKFEDAMWDQLMPPTAVIGAAGDQLYRLHSEDPSWSPQLMRVVPVVGNLAYYWIGGGIEKYEERERKREMERWGR